LAGEYVYGMPERQIGNPRFPHSEHSPLELPKGSYFQCEKPLNFSSAHILGLRHQGDYRSKVTITVSSNQGMKK
jgi:hypothetical protein